MKDGGLGRLTPAALPAAPPLAVVPALPVLPASPGAPGLPAAPPSSLIEALLIPDSWPLLPPSPLGLAGCSFRLAPAAGGCRSPGLPPATGPPSLPRWPCSRLGPKRNSGLTAAALADGPGASLLRTSGLRLRAPAPKGREGAAVLGRISEGLKRSPRPCSRSPSRWCSHGWQSTRSMEGL